MIAPWLAMLMCGAIWTTDRIPIEAGQEPDVFLAQGASSDSAQVFVLRGMELEWFTPGTPESRRHFELPAETRAFDIADLGPSGERALILILPDGVYRVDMDPLGEPALLFEFQSVYGERPAGRPIPTVLVVRFEEAMALALTGRNAFEIRGLDGSTLFQQRMSINAPQRIRFRKPFTVWNIIPAQVGAPGAAEGYADLVLEPQPELPAGLDAQAPLQAAIPTSSPASRMLDAADAHYTNWPWFTVHQSDTGTLQCLYALSAPDYEDTLFRFRLMETPQPPAGNESPEATPEKRYRGRFIPSTDPTDINGDGYADVLLWSAPDPAMEWSRLSEAAATSTWPIRISLHLFAPRKGRYEPQPTSILEMRVPISWLLDLQQGAPVRHFVAADLDGDGRGDVAFSERDNTLSAWLSRDGQLAKQPSGSVDFGEPIEALVFAQALRPSAGATLCIRTASALHVLSPLQP